MKVTIFSLFLALLATLGVDTAFLTDALSISNPTTATERTGFGSIKNGKPGECSCTNAQGEEITATAEIITETDEGGEIVHQYGECPEEFEAQCASGTFYDTDWAGM